MKNGTGSDRSTVDLGSLTVAELDQLAAERVLVIPIGATEQHGPYLPLSTDTILIESVVSVARDRLQTRHPVVIAPVLPYGQSQHHLFAGAISLRPQTLITALSDMIDSAYVSGFRRVFIANGHGGNDESIRIAVKDGANRCPMVLGACNYWDLAEHKWRERYAHIPGHAGAFEASLLLATAPQLVQLSPGNNAKPGPPGLHEESIFPGVTVARSGDWSASGGYTDSPGEADEELGKHYLESLGENLAVVLERFAELPLTLEEE